MAKSCLTPEELARFPTIKNMREWKEENARDIDDEQWGICQKGTSDETSFGPGDEDGWTLKVSLSCICENAKMIYGDYDPERIHLIYGVDHETKDIACTIEEYGPDTALQCIPVQPEAEIPKLH